MKQKLLYTLLFGTVIVITGCGGGGGGGGATSYVSPDAPVTPPLSSGVKVPFSTPTAVGSVAPLGQGVTDWAITSSYSVDLTGTGAQNVVIAGRESASNTSKTDWKNATLSVFGWSGGKLVDQTSQWFSGTDNIIVGTEPSVKFGNFNGNGKSSMYVAPSTDGQVPVSSAQIFVNNGTSFTRQNIDFGYNLWSHDSTTFNYNGQDAIVSLDYGPNGTFIFGAPGNTFKSYSVNNWAFGGSSIAAGDFLGNGTTTFIVSDTGNLRYSTRLFNWSQDPVTGAVSVNDIGTLPLPRFEMATYDGILPVSNLDTTGNRSHNIRTMAFDFDNSGIMSAFIISRPSRVDGSWLLASEFQMLKNNGAGIFTDVTDTTVFGYDKTKGASYNPTLVDVNNDGLIDIVLPGALVNDTQVLIHTKEQTYIAGYANVLTDFQKQVFDLQTPSYTGDKTTATVTFVVGPGGDLYLLDIIPDQTCACAGATATRSLYLSKLGSTSTALNAQATITAIKQQWPWMSDASVNSMLAATGKTWFGAIIIDDNAIWNPAGQLNLSTVKGLTPINGYVAGLQINSSDLQVVATDQYSRSFRVDMNRSNITGYTNSLNMNAEYIDQYNLSSHTEYLINGAVNTYGPFRMGIEERNASNMIGSIDGKTGLPIGPQPRNYSFGIPRLWSKGNWSMGTQYTTLSSNPWFAFGGSWGMVTNSATLDHVVSYQAGGFSARGGMMYTTTNFIPGMITNITPITGAWGETGYRWNDLGVYAGIKPVVLSGSLQANMPTSVDNNGNVVYTKKNLAVQNQTTGYVRALWNTDITKETNFRVSGTVMTNGQYRLMNELRFFFD